MGFHAPALTVDMPVMQGGLPQIVALPLGPCVPFHIKAPSWRELLKLMAIMSGTRIEPTVEALAQTKSEPKLRTVVQFIKVRRHPSVSSKARMLIKFCSRIMHIRNGKL